MLSLSFDVHVTFLTSDGAKYIENDHRCFPGICLLTADEKSVEDNQMVRLHKNNLSVADTHNATVKGLLQMA